MKSFQTRNEMIAEITRLGIASNITVQAPTPEYAYMLVCENQPHTKCAAKILGLFCHRDKMFHIERIELVHKCYRSRTAQAVSYELLKPKYTKMRLGETLTALIENGLKISYFELYKLMKPKLKIQEESNRFYEINKEFDTKTISQLKDETKENCRNIPTHTDELECLEYLNAEFVGLNPKIQTNFRPGKYFFKCSQYSKVLRDVVEIRVYERMNGYVVFGVLYDPSNQPLVQSVAVSEGTKKEAVEFFLQSDGREFYVIDMDNDMVELMRRRGTAFFLKTRSVCMHLCDDLEDSKLYEYYMECNYGEREFLAMDKKCYLRKYCEYPLYNVNNNGTPEFSFVSDILETEFFECLNMLIFRISQDIKSRKETCSESLENRVSKFVVDYFESFKNIEDDKAYEVDLVNKKCSCGKFQEFLLPCTHAMKKMQANDLDPYYYVSSVYLKDKMHMLHDIIPLSRF